MALMNRHLQQMIETIFVMPNEQYSYTSSSLVKQVARYGGQVGTSCPLGRRRGPAQRLRQMTFGGNWARWLGLAVLAVAPIAHGTLIGDATELFARRKYAEARAILEPLAAAEPSNAAAAYLLGMAFLRQGGPTGLDSARLWLGKATTLVPEKEPYLADYAGVCLLMADRDSSFSLAMEGREAMTRAVAAKPDDLDACDGLMKFYAKAPWPLGNAGRALGLAAQISRYDPKRGAAAYRSIQATFERTGRAEQAKLASDAAQSLAPVKPK